MMENNPTENTESDIDETELLAKYEERLEELETENDNLRQRLDDLEETVMPVSPSPQADEDADEAGATITRRGTLASLAGVGVLGAAATGSASAQQGTAMEVGGSYSANIEPGRMLDLENTAGSGQALGIRSSVNSGSGSAIRANNKASSNAAIAVRGDTQSSGGTAIIGNATSSSGTTKGLRGQVFSPDGIGLSGESRASSGSPIGVRGSAENAGGVAVLGLNVATSGDAVGVEGRTDSPDGYGLYTPDDCKIDGDLQVQGTKNFVQAVDTPSGAKEVVYTAVESGTPRTEATDVAELSDGRTEIELPDHFAMVTSEDEHLSVQVTPYADEEAKPQVVECSTDRIIVEDFSDGAREYTFAYTVKGVREGFEDREVVQDS